LKRLCVVTEAHGGRDALITGKNGFLTHSENEMRDVLAEILNKRVPVEELVAQARQITIECFNTEQKNRKLTELYSKWKCR
jgi:glycosyltransferase involved in cell wall biosynthesis